MSNDQIITMLDKSPEIKRTLEIMISKEDGYYFVYEDLVSSAEEFITEWNASGEIHPSLLDWDDTIDVYNFENPEYCGV